MNNNMCVNCGGESCSPTCPANNNKKPFKTPARITKAQTLSNGDIKLSINTSRQLKPNEVGQLMKYNQEEGWLLFAPMESEPDEIDIPDHKPKKVSSNHKTPSQRLRSVIWVKCKQEKGEEPDDGEFQNYYENYMERIIESIKDKLD